MYPPWGEYKIIVKDIDPEFTLGKLAQSRLLIIQYLKNKGLLDRNKQLRLPAVPLSVGLITQKGKEGYTDFIGKIKESGFAFKVKFHNVSVQGEKVELEVCEALEYFNQKEGVDVIVIVRGGGAKTDLSWFDNKQVAEKIAFMRIPVITGIGHRTDFTITDMVAFASQQTPSTVATFLVERITEFLKAIDSLAVEISHGSRNLTKLDMQKLKELKNQLNRESVILLERDRKTIKELKNQINRESVILTERDKKIIKENYSDLLSYYNEFIRNIRETIKNYSSNISFLDPVNALRRGFSVSKVNGRTIRSIRDAKIGEGMVTMLSDGEIKSTINQ